MKTVQPERSIDVDENRASAVDMLRPTEGAKRKREFSIGVCRRDFMTGEILAELCNPLVASTGIQLVEPRIGRRCQICVRLALDVRQNRFNHSVGNRGKWHIGQTYNPFPCKSIGTRWRNK